MAQQKTHISVVAIPDAVISTLGGIYDVFNALPAIAAIDDSVPTPTPLQVEIVAQSHDSVPLASGLSIAPHRGIDEVIRSDIIIVPSVLLHDGWRQGRYPALVAWLKERYEQGAVLCSACSGLFLLAETGLFDGHECTVHWAYANQFRRQYPEIPVSPEKPLVVSGERQQLISSGASTSWQDLVLYLLAQHTGPTAAQAIAKFFALQWHLEGLAPYAPFMPVHDHGDATVLEAQRWLERHYSVASPVDEMVTRSGLAQRTFKRRFSRATGLSPIGYVQQLRIDEAKRRLERTRLPVDEISWQIGYEDPAFFRRLFKRLTGITPGAHRRRFQLSPAATESPRPAGIAGN